MTRPGARPHRYLLLANGSAEQTTGRLFTSLAAGLRSRHHDVEVSLRSFPRGVGAKLASFAKSAWQDAWQVQRSEIVVVHTALSLSLWPMLVARLLRRPVIAFIWDIYPASTRVTQSVTNSALLGLYGLTERLGYQLANRLVVPSADYVSALPHAAVRRQVVTLPLWPCDSANQTVDSTANESECLQVAFAGQINGIRGLSLGVDSLLEAWPGRVRLHIFSRDACPPHLKERAIFDSRFEVVEEGFVSSELLQARLSSFDVGWACLDPGFPLPAFPSKVMTYLCAGLPILYTGPDMPALERWLSEHRFGVAVKPGKEVALAGWAEIRRDLLRRRDNYFKSMDEEWFDLARLL